MLFIQRIKDLKNYNIFLLLAILVAMLSFACVVPNTQIITETPQNIVVISTKTPSHLKNMEDSQQNCQELSDPITLGKVVASPKGGLNIRDLPLDEGGNVVFTVKDGASLEIFIVDTGNGWSKVRYLKEDGAYICGYSNNKYIELSAPTKMPTE